MLLLKPTTYTIKDIYNLPDGHRAELIYGQIYNMAPPNRIHQKLIHQLDKQLGNYVDSKHGTCEVYPAPFAVFLTADDKTYIEPDLSVICDKSKLTEKGCNGAPDFIIEIVSPSSRKMDYSTKMTLYSETGVREYWIIDPAKARTTIYYYEEDAAPIIIPFSQNITSGIFNDFNINIANLL